MDRIILKGKSANEFVKMAIAESDSSIRRKDRKDKIELLLAQAQKLDGTEAIQAWRRLCRELGHLVEPESRMPRFNGLLHALWIAASNDQT